MSAYSIATRGLPQGVLTPMGGLLFAASEPGAWYDPSDMSTLFQDSAGTTAVTAVEQPVGLIRDKSGRGNHASQATTTNRPVLSRRVNLLVSTEDLTGASWSKSSSGTGSLPVITPGQLAPDGSSTAFRVQLDRGAGSSSSDYSFIRQTQSDSTISKKRTIWCKSNTGSTQTFSLVATLSSDVVSATTSWTSVTGSSLSTAAQLDISNYGPVPTTQNLDIIVWHPDMRGNNTPFGVPAYQRVNTATDYDADPDKFPAYLRADGVDDSLASSTGGGGTTGFFFSAAISPQGSAGTARTLFSDAGTNTGYIVRLNASNQLELSAGNGTAYTTIATAGALNVGATDVVQAWDDGANLNVKIGTGPTASIARPVVSAGTAGYTLYQDNGASTGYFNGRSYGEIYRKDSGLTQSQREAVAVYQRKQARSA